MPATIRIPVLRPHLPAADHILPYLRQIDQSRWYSNCGPLVRCLEEKLAAQLGFSPGGVVTAANATAGITAALLARGVKPGSLCIMPAWTFCATPHAARAAGLVPWFHDVDASTWALDPACVREKLRAAPAEVGALIVVSPFGAPLPVAEWEDFERETGIPVVIDAAAAFDTVVPSEIPTVVSLHATKALGAGEGGFVATTNDALLQRIRACCNFGFQGVRSAEFAALNAKMSEYHAAVALAALHLWPQTRSALIRIGQWYCQALAAIPEVALGPRAGRPWAGGVTNIVLPPHSAERVSRHLWRAGIETRMWWSHGCHLQPAFADCPRLELPVTQDLGQRVLGLPHFIDLQEPQVTEIANHLSQAISAPPRRARSAEVDLYIGGSQGAWALGFAQPEQVATLVTAEPTLAALARARGFNVLYSDSVCTPRSPAPTALSIHYPRIFPAHLVERYARIYNLYPGYLPWGRGCYPVFWALWEGTPAGATLHLVDDGIDTGPIVAQSLVEYSAADTGASLHRRVIEAERSLLRSLWPRILAGEPLASTAQTSGGTYHTKRDFSAIKSQPPETADLQKLARALDFPGYSPFGVTINPPRQRVPSSVAGTTSATYREMQLPGPA